MLNLKKIVYKSLLVIFLLQIMSICPAILKIMQTFKQFERKRYPR